MAASTAMSNVVWMIGTRPAGLSVQTAAVMVRLPNQHSADRLPTLSRHFLFSVSIDQLDEADAPLITDVHTVSLECNSFISPSDGLAVYTFPLYNTLAVQKRLACSTEPVRAPNPSNATTLP